MWINEFIIQVVEYVLSISPLPSIRTIYQMRRSVPDQVAFVCVVHWTAVPVRSLWPKFNVSFTSIYLIEFYCSNFLLNIGVRATRHALVQFAHGTRSHSEAHKRIRIQWVAEDEERLRQAHTRPTPHSTDCRVHNPFARSVCSCSGRVNVLQHSFRLPVIFSPFFFRFQLPTTIGFLIDH